MAESGNTTEKQDFYESEIDLINLWKSVWARKWLLLLVMIIFSGISSFIAISKPNLYESQVLLAPVETSNVSGLASIAGQLGGLASFANIDLGGGATSRTQEAIEVMHSWSFIENFIQSEGILEEVYASTGWNPENNELMIDRDVYDLENERWKLSGKNNEPSSWKVYKLFTDRFFEVVHDKSTGFVSVRVKFYSPHLAKEWANEIVNRLNSKFQERDARSARKNIEFLQEQVDVTPIHEMKSVFYQLIEEQTKTLMLAKGTEEYVFRVVNEARASEVPSEPNRFLYGVLGALLGGLSCIVFLFVREMIRASSEVDK